jgi:hypothetical protein
MFFNKLKDIKLVFTCLAAILHLTNIKFAQDDETDGVYIEDEWPLEIGILESKVHLIENKT